MKYTAALRGNIIQKTQQFQVQAFNSDLKFTLVWLFPAIGVTRSGLAINKEETKKTRNGDEKSHIWATT